MIGIYKITSPTKKIYIGQSIDIENRFLKYKFLHCKPQIKLYRSLKKYGFENHTFEVLCECEIIELNDKERYYQDLYSAIGINGLNCLLTKTNDRNGVSGEEMRLNQSKNHWTKKENSQKIKDKISNKLIGTVASIESRNKMIINSSKFWFGKEFSKEHKNKISLSKKGKEGNQSKIIIDISNGIFYKSLREASLIYDIKETTLCMQLKGNNKNKTNLRYA